MKNADFKKLCELIIQTNGNPACKDLLKCGYTMEHFIRLAQTDINKTKLVEKAKFFFKGTKELKNERNNNNRIQV